MTKIQTKSYFISKMSQLFVSLFVIIASLFGGNLNAQTTVQIGSGTTTNPQYPIYSCFGYSYSQIIYLGSEIVAGGYSGPGSITKIRWYYNTAAGTPSTYNNWTVYMGNTTATTVTAGAANYTPLSSLTQVFSGTVTFPAAGNWFEITLTTPFSYTGGNLMVAVDENAPNYSCSAAWRTFTPGGIRSRLLYSDTYNPSPAALPGSYLGSSTSSTAVPQIQMVFAPNSLCTGTPAPGNTLATVTTACDGTPSNLSIQTSVSGTGVSYQWQSADDAAFTTNVTNLGTTSTQATTIPATPLYFRCAVTCSSGPSTGYSNPILLSPVTPNPGNTLCSATVGCGQNPFTLSLQNATSGSVNYVWQSADNAAFTSNLITLATTTTATYTLTGQTSSKYYRCVVTCAGNAGTATSTPVYLPQGAATACYCVQPMVTTPYSYGCAQSDVIAAVAITQGTTVLYNNVSGSGCPSDPDPVNGNFTSGAANGNGYSDYTGLGSVVNLTAGNTYGCKVTAGSYPENYTAWIDFNDDGVFASTERLGYSTSSVAANSSATFPITLACNPPSGVHRLRVRCAYGVTNGLAIDPCATYTYNEVEDYLVTIDPALPCPAPSSFALTSGSQTTTGATFSWVVGCVETEWELEYGPTGFTPGTGTPETATSNPYTSVGMPCGSTLDVYLRANCLANGYSTYVGPISVTTLACPCSGAPALANALSTVTAGCPTTPFTLSLSYNYSGLTGITYQWESADDAAFTTNLVSLGTAATQAMAGQTSAKYYRCNVTCSAGPTTTASNAVYVAQNPASQCYCTPVYTYGTPDGDLISNVVISGTTLSNNSGTTTGTPSWVQYVPPTYTAANYTANLIAGNTYNVTVTIGAFTNQGIKAWIDYNDDGVFAASESIGSTSSAILTAFGTATFPITIACNPPVGTHRLRIRDAYANAGPGIDPCATYGWGETEDYLVTVDPALPCPAPSSFSSNTPTTTGATFAWVNGCVETDWEIEYGPVGFAPGSGTVESATTNPYTATGMSCGTTYDVYLRANCLGNGYSTYVGPISVTTGLCPCTGTPTPGATLSNLSSVCNASTSFTLSLQNPTTGSGVNYQWYWSLDGITYNPIGTNTSTLTMTQAVPYWYYCDVTCTSGPSTGSSTPVFVNFAAPTAGTSLATAIDAGNIGTTPYVHTENNGCYSDSYAGGTLNQASGDVWYKFNLCSTSNVDISLCGSAFDTYVHLLDGSGNHLSSNDDNGPLCSGTTSSIQAIGLAPGTYYVVTEGYSSNTGNIVLSLTAATNLCNATLNLTAFLQGYYIGSGAMQPVLNNQGLANPTTDCDNVTVELHDAAAPYAMVQTYTGVLQTNGTIACTFPASVVGNSYYIVVLQRNHVQTWSAAPVTFAATTSYNFSTSAGQAYGGNQAEVETGVFAFYVGDINQDLAIDGFDYIDMDPDIVAGNSGYLTTDANGDGSVDAFDFLMVSPNIDAGITIQAP